MSKDYECEYKGHKFTVRDNSEEARYNSRTHGRAKSKKKGAPNLVKAGVFALSVFLVTGFATKYTETDQNMSREEGVSISQTYSPSGGIETVTKGEKKHDALDVLGRMFEDMKERTASFEKKGPSEGVKLG